jgi:hypothetical protein
MVIRLITQLMYSGFVGGAVVELSNRGERLAVEPTRWFPTLFGRTVHAQLRRLRILLTHVSSASISFLSSAGPGTGARAAGALS